MEKMDANEQNEQPTNTNDENTAQIDLNEIRKDNKGEYIVRTYRFDYTQNVNGRVYHKLSRKKYKYRLKKEKTKIINKIIAKLKPLDYLDLNDLEKELDNWLSQRESRKYPE